MPAGAMYVYCDGIRSFDGVATSAGSRVYSPPSVSFPRVNPSAECVSLWYSPLINVSTSTSERKNEKYKVCPYSTW